MGQRSLPLCRMLALVAALNGLPHTNTARAVTQGPAGTAMGEAIDLLRNAIVYAGRGDTAAALDALKRATDMAPGLAEAHYRRGMLLARTAGSGITDMFQRRSAGRALARAIRLDAGNPAYYLELGRLRLKQGFMRMDAQRLFNRALEAARERGNPAAIAEVEAELGDIYHRRYQAVGHRRLLTGSAWRFDPDEAIGDPHYARNFLSQQTAGIEDAGELDLRQAEAHYRAGAAAWPAHDASTAGLLGILYDGQRYEEYHEAARRFVRAAPQQPRAHLFYGLGLWRLGRGLEASRAFGRSLSLMDPAERNRLSNLATILRRADAERYQRLTGSEREEFNRIYWSANDPLKLTPENEHQIEHLARVAYADMRFSSPTLHVRGWETDRGLIYIRYGPPPVIATFPPSTTRQGGMVMPYEDGPPIVTGDPMMTGSITTVWYYPERNLRFVFYGPPSYNFARFAGEFQAYAEDARYAMPVRYDNVPVNEALDSIEVQAAAFRGGPADSGRAEIVIFAGIPLTRMVEGVDLDEGPLQSGLFVTDFLERPIDEQRRDETVRFQATRQFEQRTYVTRLPAGQYRYRIEARQPTTLRAARAAAPVAVDAFERRILMLSDIVLADRVAPREAAPRSRHAFFLDPNPAMRYAPGEEVHLYWEIYNLAPDTARVVEYRAEVILRVQSLERHGFVANIVGGALDALGATAEGDDQVTLRYEVTDALGDRDRLPAWVAIDLDDAPNGTYVLELLITDLRTGQTALRRRTFQVTELEGP